MMSMSMVDRKSWLVLLILLLFNSSSRLCGLMHSTWFTLHLHTQNIQSLTHRDKLCVDTCSLYHFAQYETNSILIIHAVLFIVAYVQFMAQEVSIIFEVTHTKVKHPQYIT